MVKIQSSQFKEDIINEGESSDHKKHWRRLSPVWSTSFKTLLRLEFAGVTLILLISFWMSLSLFMVLLAVLLASAAFRLASSIIPLMSSKDKEHQNSGSGTV